MWDHVTLRATDLDASVAFYEGVLRTLGVERTHTAGRLVEWDRGLAVPAADRGAVEAFHRAAVGAGYRDNGAPGERPQYHPGYYGAFVLDPDGNNIELVFHDRS